MIWTNPSRRVEWKYKGLFDEKGFIMRPMQTISSGGRPAVLEGLLLSYICSIPTAIFSEQNAAVLILSQRRDVYLV